MLYSDDARRLGARPADAPLVVSECDSSVLYVRPERDMDDLDVADVVASSPEARLLLPVLLLRLDLGDVLEAVVGGYSVTMHGQSWSGRL